MLARKDHRASDKIRLVMQLRRNGIADPRILGAMEQVPRELFVPPHFQDRAYDDVALPIARDQTISQPTIVAIMTMELQVTDRHTVLEIGTGSGYQAAILSKLARRVHTIERHRELFTTSSKLFDELRLRNITPHLGDGTMGWPHAAPYERIMVTAAAFQEPPSALLQQLAPNGIMILPIDRGDGTQMLYRITIEGETYVKTPICAVRFVPLVPEE